MLVHAYKGCQPHSGARTFIQHAVEWGGGTDDLCQIGLISEMFTAALFQIFSYNSVEVLGPPTVNVFLHQF